MLKDAYMHTGDLTQYLFLLVARYPNQRTILPHLNDMHHNSLQVALDKGDANWISGALMCFQSRAGCVPSSVGQDTNQIAARLPLASPSCTKSRRFNRTAEYRTSLPP